MMNLKTGKTCDASACSDPGDEFEEEFLHLTSTTREEIQLEICTPSD